ncbi:hypothetical protein POM88_013513 [Heracleum sosnowskyi]|uniref:DUF4283 domain-containing protein n=1 Tax=Heracleum sosnowskyi TaxID=360622 RepID=A0AAD8N3D0_9APIA|nr:hypothetical protein POM88_013513 [Heracleum sosnowskyi]
MLLSAWGTNPCISPITSMPLWIKISKIPDCYWTSTGLSSIASVVGNPLGADELTSKLDVLPFAKVCVQYEIGAALPSKIPVMAINPCTGVKEEVDVLISYPIKPLVCTSCKSLGHSIAACPVTKRVWVEKRKQPPVEPPPPEQHNIETVGKPDKSLVPEEFSGEQHLEPRDSFRDTTSNTNAVNNVLLPEVDSEQGWTQVKSKKTKTTPGPEESPPLPSSFKNLKAVDEFSKVPKLRTKKQLRSFVSSPLH